MNIEDKYLRSISQQFTNVQEQIDILDELYTDYIMEKKLKPGSCSCDSLVSCIGLLKNLCKYYYEEILHKLRLGSSKEE